MKKVLTILSVLLALSASAQNTHKQSNSNTNEEFQGSVEAKVGFINAHFTDTSAANRSWIKNRPFAQITTGQGSFWLRDATATRWIGTGSATINISPDSSSLIICNGIGSCDTIPVAHIAPITNFTVISDTSIVVCGVNSCDTVYTLPINYNQNVVNRVSVVNGVTIDSVFYFINGLRYLAGTIKNAGTQGSILNDSTFLLCNSNSCDTFIVRNITINSFSFTSDSTVSVCNTAGSCDTITFNPIPLGKFFVDSTKMVPGAVDTLFYWINGVKYIGGFINHLSTVNDGIISGGIVTYSGSGLTYYVSAATYVIGGEFYSSPDTTITLDAADVTNPRIDLFAVDTLGHVLKITGIAASTPLTPQVDVSQLALTTGITLAPNATQPIGTSSTLIYDENTEWTTGGTATINFNNTTSPYHGTKDALVSAYSKSSTLTFTGTTQTVNGQVLRAFINLLNSNYSFQFRFYNGTTAVSNAVTLNGFGFNPTLYNTYQNVSIPLSSFTWSGNVFDKLIITMTGKGATGTYYIDYISLESGTPVVTPPTDYSNKVDSVTTVNGSIYYWVKGMSHLVGSASGGTASGIDSASYHTLTVNSDTTGATFNRLNGTSDFLPLPFVKKTDTTVIKVHYPLWAFSSDSLALRTDSMPKLEYAIAGRDTSTWDNQTLIDKQFLQDRISAVTATGITRTELQDTAAAIRGSMGSGSVLSVTGNPSNLVDNTDPANPVIQQDVSKLDKNDSTIANRVTANTSNIATNTTNIASNTTAIAGKQNTIITGSNISLTGSVLSAADSSAYISYSIVPYGTDSTFWIFNRRSGVSDTIVMAKNGVDSIWRTAGKDSIQFSIRGRYYAIKDSTGGGGLASAWLPSGNSGLTAGTNFLGNIDYVPIEFRIKNRRSGYIDSSSTITGITTFGYGAGLNNTATTSTFNGFFSGKSNTTGSNNTAVGNLSLVSNTTGVNITAFGSGAAKNVTASSGTYIGSFSGELTTGASGVVGLGGYTLRQNTGVDNTAIGFGVLQQLGAGSGNTGVGKYVLSNGVVSGSNNTGLGNNSLLNLTSGTNNLGLGAFSGKYLTTEGGIISINSYDRSTLQGEQIQAPIYIKQVSANLAILNQYVTLNGRIGQNKLNPTAWFTFTRGTPAATTAPAKFEQPITLNTTSASGNGTSATIQFLSTTYPPFVLGSTITVSGVTPSGYNGTFTVLAVTDSSVSYINSTTGAQTVAGTITQGGILTAPEAGALENDSTALYYTGGTGTNLQRNRLIKGISGTATLSSGTVTVSTTYIRSGSRVLLTVATPSGTQGFLSAPTTSYTSGTSFVINSTSATETSTVNWLIINP